MLEETEKKTKNHHPLWTKFLMILSVVGPGLITANIDNDAGGIATYSLAGAQTGLRLLWVFVPVTIALIMVQEMSARMGIVSGKGLADLIREKFGLKVTFYTLILLVFADLGNSMAEFAGIASAGEIFGISKYYSVPISSIFVWLLVVKGDYKVVERIFLFGCTIYFAYIISGILIGPDWVDVATNIFIPNISTLKPSDYPIIVGLIGTTITPWMQFYIQSAVVEKGLEVKDLFFSKIDVIVGCLFMLIVTLFITITSASTIHNAGIVIHDAKDAALALGPLAGKYASVLFAIGLFNASIFAAALLPLATSYYVCEGLGLDAGVDKTIKEAPHFFAIFSGLIIVSALAVLTPGINLFKVLIWSQVVNGILIPIIILYIINLCNDSEVVGEYTNSKLYNFFSYTVVLLMIAANSALIFFEFKAL